MLFSRSDLVSVLPLLALQVQVPASDRQAEGCHKQLLHWFHSFSDGILPSSSCWGDPGPYIAALCHQRCRKVCFCRVLRGWSEPCGWFSVINTSCLHRSRLARNLGLFSAADVNPRGHSEGSCLPPLGWKTVCASLCLQRLQADRGMCAWKARDRWRSFMLQLVAQGLSPLLVTHCCVITQPLPR